MKVRINKKNRSGFTLIELLIVIGLMGALTALILPKLSASREEAIGDVCDYNQAGTLRVLKEFKQMTGQYPSGLHNGLNGIAATATKVDGLPDYQSNNMVANIATTLTKLTANQSLSLSNAGITSIAYDTGYNTAPVAADVYVARCDFHWKDDGGKMYQFDGVPVSTTNGAAASGTKTWEDEDANGTTEGIIVTLWVAPTTDWSMPTGNKDWTKGSVELGIDLAGKCPVPVSSIGGGEPTFAYYMAYFKVYDDGTAAKLVGTSCPECGVLNP
jgi:prepilin-type N-terminal cleavage/methylation domain-containing protein